MTRLQERNVHCLDKKAAGGQKARLTQTFTGACKGMAPPPELHKAVHRGGGVRGGGLSFLLRVDGDVRIKQ